MLSSGSKNGKGIKFCYKSGYEFRLGLGKKFKWHFCEVQYSVEYVESEAPKVVWGSSNDSARGLTKREAKILLQLNLRQDSVTVSLKLNIWLQIKIKKRS
jgi:hypothetical protein